MVFDQTIPDRGRALVRANYIIKGTGSTSGIVHGWSAQVDSMGDAQFAGMINFGVGEDSCPGEVLTKRALYFGNLTDSGSRVALNAYSYRSSSCENGAITIGSGSTLEVWVEDSNPACVGKDVVAYSYFKQNWAINGSGSSNPIGLDTNLTTLLSTQFESPGMGTLKVYGQTEVSPSSTANQCGNRYQTAAGFVGLDGSWQTGDTQGYAPSGGMSHVLLSPQAQMAVSSKRMISISLGAAVNQAEHVGAPTGGTYSGDTILGIVFER